MIAYNFAVSIQSLVIWLIDLYKAIIKSYVHVLLQKLLYVISLTYNSIIYI
jgi:hypothetical protein